MLKNRAGLLKLNETSAMQLMLLSRQFSMILLAVFFAKRYAVSDIGMVESLQFLLATLSVFWLNGILQWFLPAYHRFEENDRPALLWRVTFLLSFLAVLLSVVVFSFKPAIFRFFLHSSPFEFLGIFLVYALLMLPSYFLEYVLYVDGKFRKLVVVALLTLFFQNLPVFFGFDLPTVFAVWALIAGLRVLYLLFSLPNFSGSSVGELRNTFILTLPLIVYALISQWAATYNSWLVNYLYKGDLFTFTIFRYGARELPLALSLATGLSAAMSGAISRNMEEGLQMLKKKSEELMHLLFPFTIVLLLTSNWWFPFVFSGNLSDAVIIFDIFLLLVVSRMLFPQSVALALGENRALLWISVAELLVNMLLSFFLATDYGLVGIALGTLLAYLAEKFMIAAWLGWRHQLALSRYTSLRWFFAYSGLIVVVFIIKYACIHTFVWI